MTRILLEQLKDRFWMTIRTQKVTIRKKVNSSIYFNL